MNEKPSLAPLAQASIACLQLPATRREMLLFGLVVIAIAWAVAEHRERHIIVVPDSSAGLTVIT